jgi:hypothetical protein
MPVYFSLPLPPHQKILSYDKINCPSLFCLHIQQAQTMSNAAHKRSRDTDEKINVSKRVKEHNPVEKIGQQAAASETFRRAPLFDGVSVWHDEIVKISTKDFLQVCNTVLLFYDYDLYVPGFLNVYCIFVLECC